MQDSRVQDGFTVGGIAIDPAWIALAAGVSLVLAVGGALVAPWLIVRVPADYLMHEHTPAGSLSPGRILVRVLRHILAVLLLISGIAMLVLPGQGLLTILVALALMDLPRKRRLLRGLLRRTRLGEPINRLRARKGRPPLRLE